MERTSENVIGGVGADATGWMDIGRGPTDPLLDVVERWTINRPSAVGLVLCVGAG